MFALVWNVYNMPLKHQPFHAILGRLQKESALWASTVGLTSYCSNYAYATRFFNEQRSSPSFLLGKFFRRAFIGWNQGWIRDIWDYGPLSRESLHKILATHTELVLENLDAQAKGSETFLSDLKTDINQLLSFFSKRILFGFRFGSNLIDGQVLVQQVFGGEPHFEERLAIHESQIIARPNIYALLYDRSSPQSAKVTGVSLIGVRRSDWNPTVINAQTVTTAMILETHYQAPIQSVQIVFPDHIRIVPYSSSAKGKVLRLANQFLSMADLSTERPNQTHCASCLLSESCNDMYNTDSRKKKEAHWPRNRTFRDPARFERNEPHQNLPRKLITSQQLRKIIFRSKPLA